MYSTAIPVVECASRYLSSISTDALPTATMGNAVPMGEYVHRAPAGRFGFTFSRVIHTESP